MCVSIKVATKNNQSIYSYVLIVLISVEKELIQITTLLTFFDIIIHDIIYNVELMVDQRNMKYQQNARFAETRLNQYTLHRGNDEKIKWT